MISKTVDLLEAIQLIKNGNMVAVGGYALYRRPVALTLGIIKQGLQDLTILGMTLGFETDILVGSGCVREIRTSLFSLESFGLAPQFRNKSESQKILITEETQGTISNGLYASLTRVSFIPSKFLLGTDFLAARPDIKLIECPYTKDVLVAHPAIKPDVAIIHSKCADAMGNAVLFANYAIDKELALAAKVTIVSTEKLVPTEELPEREVAILGPSVQAVVEAPNGAYPTSCYPYYGVNGQEIVEYIEACQRGEFDNYLKKFMHLPYFKNIR